VSGCPSGVHPTVKDWQRIQDKSSVECAKTPENQGFVTLRPPGKDGLLSQGERGVR